MKKYNVAVVGATGLVGQTFLKICEKDGTFIENLYLFASPKSVGKKFFFNNKRYTIQGLSDSCFNGVDIVFFFVGCEVAKKYVPIAIKSGCYVIDNSSQFRQNVNVPLVVPEVNFDSVNGQTRLISNPNCSTIQCVVPLKIISENYAIEGINFNTYQSVSGMGQKGISAYIDALFGGNGKLFKYDICKTCIPQIGDFCANGYTKEEMKMIIESKKILNDDTIKISATCVRVPVKNCHGVTVNVRFKNRVNIDHVKNILKGNDSVTLCDDIKNELYPVGAFAYQSDKIYVGRIRKDLSQKNAIIFYCVCDNLLKGASLNAFQIAVKMIESGYVNLVHKKR